MKPQISAMENVTAEKGSSVELRCSFSGDGEVTPYWTFQGNTLGAPKPDQPQPTVLEVTVAK